MSLKTWKEEFYPIEAKDTIGMSAIDLIKHSLRKWEGLTKENLEKHKCHSLNSNIYDDYTGKPFSVSSISCSLCEVYFDNEQLSAELRCLHCPLAITRKGIPCDKSVGPFIVWIMNDDPSEMIEWLNRTLKKQEKIENKKVIKKVKEIIERNKV